MIKYEGVTYQLNALIQFDALQNFLEALAKKQADHEIILYGVNSENSEKNQFSNTNNNINIQQQQQQKDQKDQKDQNNELTQKDNETKNVKETDNNLSKGLIEEIKSYQHRMKQLEYRISCLENRDYKGAFIDSLGVQVKSNKNEIESLQKKIFEMDKSNTNTFKIINDILRTKVTQKELDLNEKKLMDTMNAKITVVTKELTAKNSKLLEEEITKLNSAIDKNILDIINNSKKITEISGKLYETNQELLEKATKEEAAQITTKITNSEKNISSLQNFQKNQKQTNMKNMTSINTLTDALNKLEAQIIPLNNISSNQKVISTIENMDNIIAKTVDVDDYKSDIAHLNNLISKLDSNLKDYTKTFGGLILEKKGGITMEDLNNLENILKDLINQQSLDSQKKFADKTGVNKSIHSLEGQLKHLMSDFDKEKNKEAEKSDVCMLSSKPLNGYKCASCEKYIGDLKENIQYLPWNKFPNDMYNIKRYRMGNGFSRLLQSMNIEDIKDLKNNFINENIGEGAIKNISITNACSNINFDVDNFDKSNSDNEFEKGKNKTIVRNKNKFPLLKTNAQAKSKFTKTFNTDGDDVNFNIVKINGKEFDSKIKKKFLEPEPKTCFKDKSRLIICCEKGDNTERTSMKSKGFNFNFYKPPLNKIDDDLNADSNIVDNDERISSIAQKQFSEKKQK